MKKHNFYAGPAILPDSVMKEASQACIEYKGTGLALIEMSHRSKPVVEIMDRAVASVKKLFGLEDRYQVLFLQGGASTQFFHVPFNFLPPDGTAAYLDTGSWSNKAIKEARHFGNVNVVASSKESNFNYIPKAYEVPADSAYFHITTNNTIFGTQIKDIPKVDCPLIADMSSDLFSCPRPANDFAMIYAGAQKNLGPAGTTMVIIDPAYLGKTGRDLPSMVDYQVHIDKESMYNTPPVFAFYVCMLTMDWILEKGGLQAMEKRNRSKADKLYGEIDRNGLFEGTAAREDRSDMNVTFVGTNPDLDADFLSMADEAGIVGIKGHRSVGGFRASIYNAIEESSVDVLVEVMREFERRHG